MSPRISGILLLGGMALSGLAGCSTRGYIKEGASETDFYDSYIACNGQYVKVIPLEFNLQQMEVNECMQRLGWRIARENNAFHPSKDGIRGALTRRDTRALKQREQDQQDAERETTRQELAERDRRAALNTAVRARGLKEVRFDSSVTAFLQEAIRDATPLSHLQSIAVEPGLTDRELLAIQVMTDGSAIFSSDRVDFAVIVRGYDGTIYEGTSLVALHAALWRVSGVQSYTNPLRYSRQAFVIEVVR